MNLGSQPLVSVVTPVYNGERYLEECIESVFSQTYPNWEYIIVNNCSKDRTLEIAEKYAKEDNRIQIHGNREFLNALQNHNLAFSLISPESGYCKVVHADDWMFPECLTQMVKVAEDNPKVGVVGSYGLWGNEVQCDGLPYPSTVVSGRDICRRTLLGEIYPFLSPSSLLIRSDLIRSRGDFYNEAYLHADVEACYEILRNTDFGFVHQVLTFIRRHDESLTSSSANKLDMIMQANLDLLLRYGPVYLEKEEYERLLSEKIKHYYRSLGRSVFQNRGKEFWSYHREKLKKMGFPLNSLRLTASAARYLSSLAFSRLWPY
jgi:glycosyltransferase involved in cell wall biosynthesis